MTVACSGGGGGFPDAAAVDARVDVGRPTDGGRDAAPGSDAGADASPPTDAGADASPATDGGTDAGADASPATDGGTDAGADAGPASDAGADARVDGAATTTCPGAGIHTGDTVALDGDADLDAYPATQRLTPGGTLGPTDEYAVTWDRDYLYITLVSGAFADGFKPVHVYLEAAETLGAATPSDGKEYSGLVAALPFTATHLLAFRRTSVGGDGVSYNGIYVPSGPTPWATQTVTFREGEDVFTASDGTAMSVRVSWADLGCPSELRLTMHVVNAAIANEWKDFLPLAATPWAAPGGAYYELDLRADPDVSGWVERSP